MSTRRVNCWEFKGCGREPDGVRASETGVCPAASAEVLDGLNHGRNGGRACWAVAGTHYEEALQGSCAMKFGSCLECDFYKKVVTEEGREIASSRVIRDQLDGGSARGKPR